MRPTALAWAAAVIVGLAAGAPCMGQEAAEIQVRLPRTDQLSAEATGYLYRMGWDEMKAKLAGTTPLATIQDPAIQEFFAEVRRAATRPGPFAPVMEFLLSAMHQELVAAGAGRVDADEQVGQRTVSGQTLMVRPAPERAAAFKAAFDAACKALKDAGNEPLRHLIGQDEFLVFGRDPGAWYTIWKDDRLLVAKGEAAAEAMLKPAGKSLADSPRFRSVAGPVLDGFKDRPVAFHYYDLDATWRRLGAKDPGRLLDRMSWRSIDALAGASFIEGKGYRNRHYWKLGERRIGLFAHSPTVRVNAEWVRRVPADASGFITGLWSPEGFIYSLMLAGGRMFGDVELEDMAEAAGAVTMFQPLLATLGPRYLVYRTPRKYSPIPMMVDMIPIIDVVTVAELADPAGFEQELGKLLEQMGGSFLRVEKLTVKGHKVLAVNMMYATVYMAIVNKDLILTLDGQMLKDALDAWADPGKGLVETPAYKEAAKRLLPDACFQLYIAPGGFARGTADRYIPMGQQAVWLFRGYMFSEFGNERPPVDPAMRGFDPMVLPRGADLARHVSEGTILSARDDGAGVLFDGYAPLLSASYYWMYVHLWTRFVPDGRENFAELLQMVIKPSEVRPLGP